MAPMREVVAPSCAMATSEVGGKTRAARVRSVVRWPQPGEDAGIQAPDIERCAHNRATHLRHPVVHREADAGPLHQKMGVEFRSVSVSGWSSHPSSTGTS